MIVQIASVAVAALFAAGTARGAETFTFQSNGETRSASLCKPVGSGPFPAIVYNHGSSGGKGVVGGAPNETCKALAQAGYVGLSPYRTLNNSLREHHADIEAAVAAISTQPDIDSTRIGIMGFSQGAMLSFNVAARNPKIKAVVVMAGGATPKCGAGEAAKISSPVLILVAANDTGSRSAAGHNVVKETQEMADALRAAGKDVVYNVYPSYPGDGHQMFSQIGSYWHDVLDFLKKHM